MRPGEQKVHRYFGIKLNLSILAASEYHKFGSCLSAGPWLRLAAMVRSVPCCHARCNPGSRRASQAGPDGSVCFYESVLCLYKLLAACGLFFLETEWETMLL